jgi:hypothetical protein
MTTPTEQAKPTCPKCQTRQEADEQTQFTVTVDANALLHVVWMARRYAHGRNTYAPELFNECYDKLIKGNNLTEQDDSKAVPTFPYAV